MAGIGISSFLLLNDNPLYEYTILYYLFTGG